MEYYEEFMRNIYHLSHYPVWGVSHAGHVSIPKRTTTFTDLGKTFYYFSQYKFIVLGGLTLNVLNGARLNLFHQWHIFSSIAAGFDQSLTVPM